MVGAMKPKASARRIEPLRLGRHATHLLAAAKANDDRSSGGAEIGVLVGVGPSGEAWVDVPRQGRRNVAARSTVALEGELVGREVLLVCLPTGEVVINGIIREAGDPTPKRAMPPPLEAQLDAERIVFSAQREVVLRCGRASILLSADGSVVIKGARLLTSATGVHRIRGGSVQIN